MDITQRGVIALLISAVTGKAQRLPDEFDLESVYPKLKKHHMDAMLYEGALCCGVDPESPVMKALFRNYCRVYMTGEGQLREVQRVFAAFDAKGIDYLPLKGIRMKTLYPKAELRTMGDVDVLIRTEQYEQIKPVMEDLDFTFRGESDHELQWSTQALFVELHKHLIPSYNEDYYAYFGTGWQFAKPLKGNCFAMSAEDEWIFLFAHFAKHFRDGGVGCRYMVDLWVYLRSYPSLDWEYIREELTRLQLLAFHEHIRTLLRGWFENGEVTPIGQVITDFIFSSGSWGSLGSKAVSVALRDAKKSVGWRGKIAYFLQTFFPSAKSLSGKYKVLQKAPWMLPLVWLYRPIYKMLFQWKRLWNRKQALDMVTTENLAQRQEFLHSIGLDYNF